MEFQFQERPALEIRGRRYEADLSDVGFLEAVVTDFSAILREYEELARAREKLSADRVAALSAEECRNTSRQLARCSERLVELSRGFIEKTLGKEAYAAAFCGRRPNCAEHIRLCADIYETAAKGREKVVNRYVLRDKPVQRGKRTPTKPAGGRKKGAD